MDQIGIGIHFQATIKSSDSNTKGLIFLPNLAYEITEASVKLNEDHIESIFMEILTEVGIPKDTRSQWNICTLSTMVHSKPREHYP